jgi:hypothetical protein
MATQYDATEFVDTDFQAHKSPYAAPTPAAATASLRAPTREEVEVKVTEAQQKLVALKRAQEELERERSTLEELRRRQMEFQTGRTELVQQLARGLGLLEEAEFAARRDAEQMAKSIGEMRDALGKVQALHEAGWTQDNFNVELTRALTTIENARLEWNGARLKFPVLSGPATATAADPKTRPTAVALMADKSFGQLCRLGLALTWPLATIALAALGVLIFVLLRP